jgi:pimeloyl-ACP methyl ester carboxylesterase
MTPCVVFVPGTLGSVLELNGEVIWPGSVLNTFITRYDKMDKLLDPAVRPKDIIRKVFVFGQYQSILDDLERLGFHEAGAAPTLFPCAYDWRVAIEQSTRTVADVIDRAAGLHADADITLIGHSQGGLMSRHYLESGLFKTRPGFAAVKRFIALAVPHLGAAKALPVVMGLEREAFLAPDQVKVLANDPRYLSAYQLLPPEGEPFAWNADVNSRFAPLNVYDPSVAAKLELSAASLAAAKAFHATLDSAKAPVPYFCFVGTRQTTTALARLNLGATKVVDRIVRDDRDDSGDGTVPIWSAGGLTRMQALTVGGEHGTIFKNGDLRRTMGTLLGKSGILAPTSANEVEVAVRERVAEPEQPMHAALTFLPRPALDGELRFERATDETGATFVTVGTPLRLSYKGITHEKLGVVFPAPSLRGAYRVSFFLDGSPTPAGSDEFFVQA